MQRRNVDAGESHTNLVDEFRSCALSCPLSLTLIGRKCCDTAIYLPAVVVQLLSGLFEKSCNTLPLAGGSGAVATGEGLSRQPNSKVSANRIDPLRP